MTNSTPPGQAAKYGGNFKKGLLSLLLCTTILFAFSQPTISSFSPASGQVGSSVIITGTNFSAVQTDNVVYFGAVKAAVTMASATSLTVTVPVAASYQPITVTVSGLTAYSANLFTVTFVNNSVIGLSSFGQKIDLSNIVGMTQADFDGDGKVDIAASYAGAYNSSLEFYRNSSVPGHDSLTPAGIIAGVGSDIFATGDFDGDGKLDIATIYHSNNLFLIFKNNSSLGNISFAQAGGNYATAYNPSAIAVGDLNGDGKPDIAITNGGAGSISIYLNTTTTGSAISFAPKVDFAVASNPNSIVIADLNSDGLPDISVANNYSASVSIFQNNSSGGSLVLGTRVDLVAASGPETVSIADMDGDGKPDIVTSNYYASTVSVIKNIIAPGTIIKTTSFKNNIDYAVGNHPYAASVADLDGDGKPDIVAANINDNSVSVLKNTTTNGALFTSSSFAPKVDFTVGTGPVSVALFDVDGDGKQDIVSSNLYSVNVSVLHNLIPGLSATVSSSAKVCKDGIPPLITFTGANSMAPYTFTYTVNGGAHQTVTTATGNTVTVPVPIAAADTLTYTLVSVSGNNGEVQLQQGSADAIIYVPGAAATITQILCNGGDGSVVLNGTGGIAPYKYKIPGGVFQAGGTFGSLAKGTYNFGVKDASGCAGTVKVVITEPLPLVVTATTAPVCFGGDATVTAKATGGKTAYGYSLNSGTSQPTGVFSGLVAGNYTIAVNDANGCTANTGINVIIPAAVSATTNVTNISCYGGDDASVILNGTGGVAPYLYKIPGSAFQADGGYSGVAKGLHNFTIKDANGCQAIVPVTITQPTAIKVTVSHAALCYGDVTAITAKATGGIPEYKYKLNGSTFQDSGIFNSQPAGDYSITVRDANGCGLRQEFDITAPGSPLGATVSVTNASSATSSDGSVSVAAIGGVSPYKYKKPGGVFQAGNIFTGLAIGTYTFGVKDAYGCIFNIKGIVKHEASFAAGTGTEGDAYKQPLSNGTLAIKVLPNPSTANFILVLKGGDNKALVEIKVMDLYGKEIYHCKGTVWQQFIFGDTFISGMYIAEVINGSQVQTVKLIKAK